MSTRNADAGRLRAVALRRLFRPTLSLLVHMAQLAMFSAPHDVSRLAASLHLSVSALHADPSSTIDLIRVRFLHRLAPCLTPPHPTPVTLAVSSACSRSGESVAPGPSLPCYIFAARGGAGGLSTHRNQPPLGLAHEGDSAETYCNSAAEKISKATS